MKAVAIIPARFASTRFPGKPLALLDGRPIVQHVYERVATFLPNTFVATDDERIFHAVEAFGGRAVMTASTHQSGTDRCEEAIERLGIATDVVVNVQGDEPFITTEQLRLLLSCFDDAVTDIATLVKPFDANTSWEELSNPNSPKVVCDAKGFALYFSRSVVPYLRGQEPSTWAKQHVFLKHIGLYGYRREALRNITAMPQGELERRESLEQLRWLEAGLRIKVAHTAHETIGIDTPEDLQKAEKFLRERQ